MNLPPFTVEQILAWADAHHRRTRRWPIAGSGAIAEAPGETWAAVDAALRDGRRGQPGGSSLARLLGEQRGIRNRMALPPFTVEQILAWADAHFQRTGNWPRRSSGPIAEAPGETWLAVHSALQQGDRGLPGGSSLARVLAEHRQQRPAPVQRSRRGE
jgi:hypothetical protein